MPNPPPSPVLQVPVEDLAAASPAAVSAALQHALALHQQGRLEEAWGLYHQVLAVQPENFDALHLAGVAASQGGNPELAVDLIIKALQLDPKHAAANSNLGLALQSLGRHEDALRSFERALLGDPGNVAAHFNRANALSLLLRHEEALAAYERVLELAPEDGEALFRSGNLLHQLNRDEEALACFRRVLQIDPAHVPALNNQGAVELALGRYAEALGSFERVLQLAQDNPLALFNRGNALRSLHRPEEALAAYDRLLTLVPDNVEVLNNRGNALRALNRLDEARASFARALEIAPDYPDGHWNLGLTQLLAGDFAAGWGNYEWRWQAEFKQEFRQFPQPLWTGKAPLAAKTILLHAEQGYGDTLQFSRYARLVEALGAKVILEVQPELKSLLQNLAGTSLVIARGEPLPDFDYQCPLLSLPLAFATDLSSIPQGVPYVVSDPEKLAAWREILGERLRPNVGLVWRGGSTHRNDAQRSIALSALLRLVGDRASFFSLQKGASKAERRLLAERGVYDYTGRFADFSDTAALIEFLDIVITVDTSVAHLAGAMGKEAWVLLPFSPDWRWLLDREGSPWYPTARLFRQTAIGAWDEVIGRVAEELESRLA